MLGLKDSYSTKSVELEKCEGELRRTLSEVSFLLHLLLTQDIKMISYKENQCPRIKYYQNCNQIKKTFALQPNSKASQFNSTTKV